jgi:putative FmdB family regulatory protein
MPVYDYQCTNCNSTYDIFHKGKELADNIVCPKCKSNEHKKLMSAASISMGNSGRGCESGNCGIDSGSYGGGCAGGMCGLN